MNNAWLKVKVWTKIALFALLAIYITLFINKNSEAKAHPWFWFHSGEPAEVSVLRLVFFAFLAGVGVTLLIRTTLTTLRQVREMRRRAQTARIDREITDMRSKASMLRPKPEPTIDVAPLQVDEPAEPA